MYTKGQIERLLSIKGISFNYKSDEYIRKWMVSHYETVENTGHVNCYINLDKVPIIINGKQL